MDTGRTDVPEPARLWRLYGEHAAALFASGPRAARFLEPRWFFVGSGARHVDMNQAALFGKASAADAEALVSQVVAAHLPCLLGCSEGVFDRVAPTLASAGFVPLPAREALFWRPGPPPSRTRRRSMSGGSEPPPTSRPCRRSSRRPTATRRP